MSKSPRRRPPRSTTPREIINLPTLLTLAAGAVVLVAFQYSFTLAVMAGIAVGLIGWLWWRGRDAASRPRAPGRRARPARRRR
jgi:hypothetical protein